jgi:LacI family transcriptional regulator
MDSNSRVAVKDVARLAGVSVATVSRVSACLSVVQESTKRRVEAAIAISNYVSNEAGRSLSRFCLAARRDSLSPSKKIPG